MPFCCSACAWGCRAADKAEGVRRRLAAVFQDAPECVEARAMEAELLLGERDFSGAAHAMTEIMQPLD